MQIMNNWGLKLDKVPAKHRGYKLEPGNIIMGPKPILQPGDPDERIMHDIDFSGSDIGIKLQNNKLFD